MRFLPTIVKVVIFSVILFGIIDLPYDIKEKPRIVFYLFFAATLLAYLAMPGNKTVNVCLITCLFVSSIGFTNFLSELICQPVMVAADCQGHEFMSYHGVTGIVYGSMFTLAIALVYFRIRNEKRTVDGIMIALCLVALVLALLRPEAIEYLDNTIDQTKTPGFILPEGC